MPFLITKHNKRVASKLNASPHFLNFIQWKRNSAIAENAHKLKIQDNIIDINEEIQNDPQNSVVLKKRRLKLHTEFKSYQTLDQFDHTVIPYLHEYYSNPQQNKHTLISDIKQNLLSCDDIPNIYDYNSFQCRECSESLIFHTDTNEYICPTCGRTESFIDTSINALSYGHYTEIHSFSYKRVQHLRDLLNRFQAKNCICIPQGVIQKLMRAMYTNGITLDTLDIDTLRQTMKTLRLSKYYDNDVQLWYQLTGKTPYRLKKQDEEKIEIMFYTIQQPFAKICPPSRKNFLSYPYCLYKFCQLLGFKKLLYFCSLLKSNKKLQTQELLFKKICLELNWPFFPIDYLKTCPMKSVASTSTKQKKIECG